MDGRLNELIEQAAIACEAENIPNDAEPCGALHRWVVANCKMRSADQAFNIVFLLACELADRSARREGFKDQGDRAASKVDWSKARSKFDPLRPFARQA